MKDLLKMDDLAFLDMGMVSGLDKSAIIALLAPWLGPLYRISRAADGRMRVEGIEGKSFPPEIFKRLE